MLSFFIPWLRFIPYGVGAVVAAGLMYPIAHWKGDRDGRAAVAAEAGILALKRITKLETNNATFKHLSNRDRCIVFMRDSGLPEDGCD